MEVTPKIFNARVMHKRLFPKVNQFTYGIYYLSLPLRQIQAKSTTDAISVNRAGFISFHQKDHGDRSGAELEAWIRNILKSHEISDLVETVTLITMPRVLGYAFNPVSFWFCFDKDSNIRTVLCEVNNTFGETHTYVCIQDDHRPISGEDWLTANKVFHVSPFLEREGSYRFRFAHKDEKLGIWIEYRDEDNNKKLLTSLVGKLSPLTRRNLQKSARRYPLVALRAIVLIHWQALKLFLKGIRYHDKPEQKTDRLTSSQPALNVINNQPGD